MTTEGDLLQAVCDEIAARYLQEGDITINDILKSILPAKVDRHWIERFLHEKTEAGELIAIPNVYDPRIRKAVTAFRRAK